LARIPIDGETFARAYQVQRELARVGGLHPMPATSAASTPSPSATPPWTPAAPGSTRCTRCSASPP
jgi:hypothetical protein